MHQSVKVILEYLPLVLFYICFKIYDLHTAIFVLAASSCASAILIRIIWKKISVILCISTFIITVVGLAYAVTGDPRIFKMKPTIVFSIMVIIVVTNLVLKGRLYNERLAKLLNITNASVNVLSKFWLGYLILCAMLNEIVWRNFSDEIWVNFKVFGLTGLNLILVIASIIYINYCSKKKHATE